MIRPRAPPAARIRAHKTAEGGATQRPRLGTTDRTDSMTNWNDSTESPLYACAVAAGGRVVAWMAFDPEYGPESEAQIDWHRRQYGEPHVRGWEVGLPLPGCKSEAARRQRERYDRDRADELVENLVQVAKVAKFAALESGNSRNGRGGTTPSTSRPFVTASCALCGRGLPDSRGGHRRRSDAGYCSPACRQRAYRERQTTLFEGAPTG